MNGNRQSGRCVAPIDQSQSEEPQTIGNNGSLKWPSFLSLEDRRSSESAIVN